MKSPRAIKIKEELLKSFAIRGTIKEIPKLEELNAQAMLVDSKLNPNIEIRHLELLFDISRAKSWHPSITELEQAYLTNRFKGKFPRKAYASDNLMKTLPISEDQQDKFEKGRKSIKLPWSVKW